MPNIKEEIEVFKVNNPDYTQEDIDNKVAELIHKLLQH